MCLHAAHEFTHAACVDGSLTPATEAQRRQVGYGIWEGLATRAATSYTDSEERWWQEGGHDREHKLQERVGAGLWGGRLPDDWEIADAEMYAILA